ncbi:MAG: hypothetical protein O3A36_01440 [bacterium]|nr:hypothetical protein [bacterium]
MVTVYLDSGSLVTSLLWSLYAAAFALVAIICYPAFKATRQPGVWWEISSMEDYIERRGILPLPMTVYRMVNDIKVCCPGTEVTVLVAKKENVEIGKFLFVGCDGRAHLIATWKDRSK